MGVQVLLKERQGNETKQHAPRGGELHFPRSFVPQNAVLHSEGKKGAFSFPPKAFPESPAVLSVVSFYDPKAFWLDGRGWQDSGVVLQLAI